MGLNLLEMATDEIDALTERRSPQQVVAEVRAELGREYLPTGYQVVVRTDPPVTVTSGGIVLTGRETGFYTGPAHQKIIKATVLTVGEQSTLKPGDRICFQRLYFRRIVELQDKTFVGSIDENQLVGFIEEE